MQLWVRPVVGIGKAMPPSQQMRYFTETAVQGERLALNDKFIL